MNVSMSIDALSSPFGFRVTVSVTLRLQSATTTQSKENSDSITGRLEGGELGTQLDPAATQAKTGSFNDVLHGNWRPGHALFSNGCFRVGLFRLRACLTPAIRQLAIAARNGELATPLAPLPVTPKVAPLSRKFTPDLSSCRLLCRYFAFARRLYTQPV